LKSFNRSHFSIYIYICTQYLHHIYPPAPFPYILSTPTVPTLQSGHVLPSCSPFL
jgi:hypothetical protein